MRGMLLGFWDGIMEIVADVLGSVFTWIIETVVTPIIRIVYEVIAYTLGIYLYNISVFILALIDYVEALFRGLAGLDSSISLGGEAGRPGDDLLIQLIRNKDIQQAFLSMCIVGIFLLIVTSVFQIIKVEYTTEGAKNAKGPILNKAIRALSNLFLLPFLVLFGIFFSNQLLGLLDTATKGSENSSISGLLFVTAAAPARYKEGDWKIALTTTDPTLALGNLLTAIIDEVITGSNKDGSHILSDAEFEGVEREFISKDGQFNYYVIQSVTNYYNYAHINYLLLIFGSCIVLKCLYYTCFGMIMRLYKCAVLFIISPVVIGMTPINDGGLGKWRTKFIGQVLAAYGTVIALNLFFIIVGVLMNIEVNIQVGAWGAINGFTTSLFKGIVVIVGCLMIEKFAGELGAFFGAEDAMAAGKGMAKEVTDTAMKGVQVAAAVGGAAMTGGASLAMRAKGIAGKLAAPGQAGDAAYREARLMGKSEDEAQLAAKTARKAARQNAWGGPLFESKESREARSSISANNESIDAKKNSIERNKVALAENQSASNKLLEEYNKLTPEQRKSAAGERMRDKLKENAQASASLRGQIAKDESGIATQESENKKLQKSVKRGLGGRMVDKAGDKISHIPDAAAKADLWMQSFAAGSKAEVKNWIPGMKQWQGVQKTTEAGAKILGPHHQEMLAGAKKDKEKAVQDKAEGTWSAQHQLANAANIATVRLTDEMGILKDNAIKAANKIVDQLKKNLDIAKQANASPDQLLGMKMNAQSQLEGLGAKIDLQGVEKLLDGTLKLDASTLRLDFNPESIKKAVKEAMEKGHSMESIQEALISEFKKMGVEGNTNLLKQIEAIIQKVMSDMGGK